MLLLFDADCGFCSRSASLLQRWGVPGVVALQSVDSAALGVDAARAGVEIPAVRDDGTLAWGADAIAVALASGPAWTRTVAAVLRAPGVRSLARGVYRLVARHRHSLPGGTATCRLP